MHDCPRVAYVGLDNQAAGATAAYLLAQWVHRLTGTVLVTLSRNDFFGERERAESFAATLTDLAPRLAVQELGDADGLDTATAAMVREWLAARPPLRAVYSIGGGNQAIAAELAHAGVRAVHIGHDLDDDNLDLLRTGRLAAVLHHDLRADMRAALRQVLRFHRLLPGAPTSVPAEVQVVTRYNVPARITPT